jgi:ketosteroid isomerase-like protein
MKTQEKFQAVLQAERYLAEAHLHLDLARFGDLLHPDYVIIQPGGKVEGKAETLASLRTGNRHWEIARSDEMDVQIYGETAVVVGKWRGKGQNGDIAFDYSARFLSVWVYEEGVWRNVAAQSTEITDDSNDD